MRKVQVFFITVLGLMVLLPAVLLNREKEYYSEIDNRNLAEITGSDFDTVSAELKTFVNERIGFREEMIYLYNKININIFDVFSHPDYDMGKNGEIFPNIIENQLYDAYRQTFVAALKKMNTYW